MWVPTKSKKIGVAIYNWKGDVRYGLPLEIGETVQIFEENSGWYRGFSTKNRTIKGIFPSNYIFIKPCRIEKEGTLTESVIPIEDPVIREVSQVLREWGGIWKNLYVNRTVYKFSHLRNVMRELLDWRRQLLTGTLTQDQTREVKLQITQKIDWGNRKLGLVLVPRIDGEAVDPDSMSVVDLHQVHVRSAENSQSYSNRGTLRSKRDNKVLSHHLYLCMRDFCYCSGEEVDIYLSLYDSHSTKYLTDRYLIQISKQGFSTFVDKLHNNCTIFTDLGNADVQKDLCIVAHVMRIGKMTSDTNKKANDKTNNSPHYKRPVGVAVLKLAEVLPMKDTSNELSSEDREKETSFKVYQCDEKDFFQLHEMIIKKQTNKYSQLPAIFGGGIAISVKMLHGELSRVKEENPMLFKNVCLTKKLGFPDIILPGDVRNDLYLTIDRGEFERGGKKTAKNIQVTLSVLDVDGQILESVICGASGMEPQSEYQSFIIYHNNSPHWSDTIRLAIPIEKFCTAHVRLEYRHCSTREKSDNRKLFGFSFARLMKQQEEDDATISDGNHELYVYKCDDRTKLNAQQYLQLAQGPEDLAEQRPTSKFGFVANMKESVHISTLLCSTKLTQNADLLSLLKWKSNPDKITDTLNQVLKLGGEELVKFLQDVLDSLFLMFCTEDGNSTPHSGQVFHVLVSLFSLLEEGKFEHFKPVMDTYITGHFAAALAYKGLISSVQHCAEFVQNSENQGPLQKCFSSLEYIFKFIIQSRLLFARATGNQYEDAFRKDLSNLFKALNSMLSKNNPQILSTQVAMLQNVSAVFEQLTQVLPKVDVTRLADAMFESLPSRDAAPQLTQAKLTAIKNMVSSQLFKDDDSRNLLLTSCCKHLRQHLAHRVELKICTEILSEIISYMYKQHKQQEEGKVNNLVHLHVEILCLNTLDILIQTVLMIIVTHAPVLSYLVVCLVGLLQLLDEYHYKRLWEEYGEKKSLRDFLLRLFLVFDELVRKEKDVFPSDWLVLKMVVNHIMLNSLQELAQPLVFRFLESRSPFDHQVWTSYFNLTVSYLTQPSLQLEKVSQVKRDTIKDRYGDMRVLMGFQILRMWSKLGEHKIKFIPSMVGPFLEVTLVPEPELRKATLHIFYDMIQTEQAYNGNFKKVENELIDKLDMLVSENKGDDEYRQLFNTILLDKVQSEDPQWKDSGRVFISSVTKLLERLLDYRSVIQGEDNRDKRMSCTFNLLNFYKNEINRKEMYHKYIYKLHELHLAAENYTEAGFTMKLYADQLSWGNAHLSGDLYFPTQLEWQRKELLYNKIIDYFNKGKCWEKGIPLCKELAQLYESKLFDYQKLSKILVTQAKFLDNILNLDRHDPEYFRVGFYGQSFPLFVRNKLFVYRGLEYERISNFTQRLQTEFPQAQILNKNSPPDESISNGEAQYIQICNVKPIGNSNVMFQDSEVPVSDKIRSYYEVNDVNRFQFDRPLPKGHVDKDNEFKNLWGERTTITISSPLPGILRWFKEIDKTVEIIPPIQLACETMEATNKELRQLINDYTIDPKKNINPFSMRLQGVIDANVMGGIAKYQEAFFTPEFAQSQPQYLPYVSRLKALILELIQVLENALILHGKLCPSGVQPLHKRLQERYYQLRNSLRELGAKSIINTPLPPLPTEGRKLANRSSTGSGTGYPHNCVDHIYEDGIYSRPAESCEPNTPPLPSRRSHSNSSDGVPTLERPPKPTHQRSLSKPLSPKSARHAISDEPNNSMRNSWSEEIRNGEEGDAPPLPPRGLTPDKRGALFTFECQTPSVPPKRPLSKKGSNSTFNSDSCPDALDGNEASVDLLERAENHNDFNDLSYVDYDLRTVRVNVQSGLNIELDESKEMNIDPTPPPIPPKSLGIGERKDSLENTNTPSENYSVPKIHNQKP